MKNLKQFRLQLLTISNSLGAWYHNDTSTGETAVEHNINAMQNAMKSLYEMVNALEKQIKTEFGYKWDDDSCLGNFWMICPNCETKIEHDTQRIQENDWDDPIHCEKCHSEFVIKRETWIEPINKGARTK